MYGCSAAANFFLIDSVVVVVIDPFVQTILQHFDAIIDLLAERHRIERLQDGFVKPFADAVGPDLGPGVVEVVDGQEEPILVTVGTTAIFCSPVGEDTQHWQAVFFVKRQDFVIEHVAAVIGVLVMYSLAFSTLA